MGRTVVKCAGWGPNEKGELRPRSAIIPVQTLENRREIVGLDTHVEPTAAERRGVGGRSTNPDLWYTDADGIRRRKTRSISKRSTIRHPPTFRLRSERRGGNAQKVPPATPAKKCGRPTGSRNKPKQFSKNAGVEESDQEWEEDTTTPPPPSDGRRQRLGPRLDPRPP